MRRLVMLVCLMVVPLLAAPASLEAFVGGPRGGWWSNPEIQQQVGLSPEQVDQLKGLWATHRSEMAELRGQIRDQQSALDDLLSAKTVDEAAVNKKIDEVAAAKAKLDKARMGTLAKVRGVLSAEQYGKLRQLQREWWHSRGRGRKACRMGGGAAAPCMPGGGPQQ